MSRPRHRTAVLAQWSLNRWRLNKASRRQFLALTAGAIALTSVCPDAMAQTYPLRPITMVVAFGAGGPSDIIARILAEGMRGSLGQPVVIENVLVLPVPSASAVWRGQLPMVTHSFSAIGRHTFLTALCSRCSTILRRISNRFRSCQATH